MKDTTAVNADILNPTTANTSIVCFISLFVVRDLFDSPMLSLILCLGLSDLGKAVFTEEFSFSFGHLSNVS